MNLILKRYKIACIIFILCFFKSFSQDVSKPSEGFPKIFPLSPNSSSLGLYGQVPINQFTGNATLSIPLLEIKSNDLFLPISLSYSSDGIKIDQYESNVGMGWALNSGGVVTRQVLDYQDTNNGRLQKPNASPDSTTMEDFLTNVASAPLVDTQPDVYSYNINGITGKFFFDDNKNPVEIEPSGIRIEVSTSFLETGIDPSGMPEIMITDLKGIKYYFGGLNAVESSFHRGIINGAEIPPTEEVKTTWYLTKIEDTKNQHIITLSYDFKRATYISGTDQNLEYAYSNSFRITNGLFTQQYKSTTGESILKEINSTSGKLVFTSSKRFVDIDFPLFKIDGLDYYDTSGVLIKKIKFDYTEYEGTTFPNIYNQSYSYLKKRFFLNKITEYSDKTNPIIHQFEYYSPENLPGRFSFAQDNYGLFNGKNNSSLISDEIVIPSSVAKLSFSDGKKANRRPDSNYGYYGLLKKVTYPTKGTTTFEYEPHVKGKENIPIYPTATSFALSVATNSEELFNNTNTSTIHSSIEQTVVIEGSVVDNCTGVEYNPFPLKSLVQVIDLSTNAPVNFWITNSNSDEALSAGTTYEFTGNMNTNIISFDLEANKDYSVVIKLLRPCMFSNIYFDYYSNPVVFQEKEKQIGGFRISRLIKQSLYSPTPEIEKYFYSPISCLTCQSGNYINQAPISFVRKIERSNLCEYPSSRILYSVGSSNLSRLYSSQNVQFGYEYVTKSFGNNFENGGEEFRYYIEQDGLPITLQNDVDTTIPFTNGFGSGRLLSHRFFNNSFTILKEIFNEYEHNTSKDFSVTGYSAYMNKQMYSYLVIAYTGTYCTLMNEWDQYSLSQYYLRSQWHTLKKSLEIIYDKNGLHPLTTTTNYTYSNPNHLQLTSQTTLNSKGENVARKYLYSKDPEMSTMPFVSELVAHNIIGTPLNTQVYNSGNKISEQLTVYAKDASTANLLLPKSVYSAKFPNSLSTLPVIGALEKKITYDLYDATGNLTQYTPEGGAPVSIVWGYDKTQPIAKIENATNAQLVSALGVSDFSAITEAQLSSLNNLRTNATFSQSMITTYTYQPLVGVTSITDPKGDTVYYTYDGLGRLQYVKDAQGKLLTDYQYHYKN
jgi:YD repeat-containing protein